MTIILDNNEKFITSKAQDDDLLYPEGFPKEYDKEKIVNIIYKNRCLTYEEITGILAKNNYKQVLSCDLNRIVTWINKSYSAKAWPIERLKEVLYSLDALTEEENIEAKGLLSKANSESISIEEKLIIMIQIKEQIVGRKIRHFYINDRLLLINKYIENKDVYSQLKNKNIHLSEGINTILYPYYSSVNKDYINEYCSKKDFNRMGYWSISRNFKELRFNYNSEKRWKDDKSFFEI